jgi:hypothetical protein
MALIRFLFWAAIFLASAFAFTVLFEHGPTHFVQNAKKEKEALSEMFGMKIERKKDDSDKLTPRIGTEKTP